MSSLPRPKSVTLKLLEPVTFEGTEHTEITLRRIKGKDLRHMAREDENDQTFYLIGLLSGWPPAGVDELDAEDIDAISKVIEGFTGKKRRGR